MNNNRTIGLFILWSAILVMELLWLNSINSRPHDSSDLIVAITVIAVTIVIGAVGLPLFKNLNR